MKFEDHAGSEWRIGDKHHARFSYLVTDRMTKLNIEDRNIRLLFFTSSRMFLSDFIVLCTFFQNNVLVGLASAYITIHWNVWCSYDFTNRWVHGIFRTIVPKVILLHSWVVLWVVYSNRMWIVLIGDICTKKYVLD